MCSNSAVSCFCFLSKILLLRSFHKFQVMSRTRESSALDRLTGALDRARSHHSRSWSSSAGARCCSCCHSECSPATASASVAGLLQGTGCAVAACVSVVGRTENGRSVVSGDDAATDPQHISRQGGAGALYGPNDAPPMAVFGSLSRDVVGTSMGVEGVACVMIVVETLTHQDRGALPASLWLLVDRRIPTGVPRGRPLAGIELTSQRQ